MQGSIGGLLMQRGGSCSEERHLGSSCELVGSRSFFSVMMRWLCAVVAGLPCPKAKVLGLAMGLPGKGSGGP